MSKKDNPLLDILQPVIEACEPLRVKVTVKIIKDKYYVHFDGTKTYPNADDWDKYWISFSHYIVHLLTVEDLSTDNIKIPKPAYAVAMVGTLFDFLSKDYS